MDGTLRSGRQVPRQGQQDNPLRGKRPARRRLISRRCPTCGRQEADTRVRHYKRAVVIGYKIAIVRYKTLG